jgi:hypothetical protein
MPRRPSVAASFARIRRESRLLYDWLRDHHDEFATELERTRVRDRWKHVMQLIADANLLDNAGNPPTRNTAMRTWKQVRADVAARAKRQATPSQVRAPGEIAPGVRATHQAASSGAWPRPAINPPEWGNAPTADSTPAAPGPDGESDVMRRLRASMEVGKVPVPKPL